MTENQDLDELILGIQLFLAKNRSSLSVDENVLLENTVKTLKELKSVKKSSIRKKLMTMVITNLLRVFTTYKAIKKLKEFFEDFGDFC